MPDPSPIHNAAGYQSLGESRTRIGKPCAPVLAVAAACAVLFLAGAQRAPHLVTQKGRTFNPGALTIQQGDTLEIVNDDGELIHHAYVASDTFSFDSGDQEPGSKTDVVFSVRGHFTVLCGIHPKMHLSVDVQ